MASITAFIPSKLKLKVNQQKSAVARPWERKFVGFSFTGEAAPRRGIAPKALARHKKRVRERTRRTRGISIEEMAAELGSYLRDGTATLARAKLRRCGKSWISGPGGD